MKIITLAILLAAIHYCMPLTAFAEPVKNSLFSTEIAGASNLLLNLVANRFTKQDGKRVPTAMPDTCTSSAVLEPMVDQVYDSMIYKWYFDGKVIDETAAILQVNEPGKYTVEISGILNGYVQVTQQEFIVPDILEIEKVNLEDARCEENNGALGIEANYETNILYSINGGDLQEENVFRNLVAGTYTITIQNSFNCLDTQTVIIKSSSLPIIEEIVAVPATCGEENGSIRYEISGGTGQIAASINSDATPFDQTFQNLAAGEYIITFVDEAGCEIASSTSVPGTRCPIYVPTVFSPNRDGINDLFQIKAEARLNASINAYLIFDRWGKLLYEAHHFPLNSTDHWWDGTFRNRNVNTGAYIYLIEVAVDDGQVEVLRGTINIMH